MPRTAIVILALTMISARPLCGAALEDDVVRYFMANSIMATDAAVAELRAAGRNGIAAIDAVCKRDDPRLGQVAWDRLYDAVGQQRGCRSSHLYWYTDLAAAEAAARAQHKPIVSLRLLGKLTDEYSCANSRFFRAMLYYDQEVASWLRDSVILHWSSERPVPQVTIDFGDGRVLRTTLTGNSAHYVLDDEGRPIDVLPGLYGPRPFLEHLKAAVACAGRLEAEPARRDEALMAFHRAELTREGQVLNAVPMPDADDRSIYAAERVTASKSMAETPLINALVADTIDADRQAREPSSLPTHGIDPSWGMLGPGGRAAVAAQLMRAALALRREEGMDIEGMLVRVEARVARDTLISEYSLHAAIHRRFAAGQAGDFAALNAWVYAAVFRTPAQDPWLGLMPVAYDGLSHLDVGTATAAK